VDPAVTTRFDDWFAGALPDGGERSAVLRGSMRPRTTVENGVRPTQLVREQEQVELAEHLAELDNVFIRDHGPGMRMLVAVNKADLLHLGAQTRHLRHLGLPDELAEGMIRYLEYAVQRLEAGVALVADDVRELLRDYLYAGGQRDVTRRRCQQLADGLLDVYGAPQSLWALVHGGDRVDLHLSEGPRGTDQLTIVVPGLSAHVTEGLQPGNARRLQMRDLVMSTLGCGIMYALGLGGQVQLLLAHTRHSGEVLFFLCSSLTSVPRRRDDSDDLIECRGGRSVFPPLGDPSAGLSQLLLSFLWKVRR
jgi:hypothetical protein